MDRIRFEKKLVNGKTMYVIVMLCTKFKKKHGPEIHVYLYLKNKRYLYGVSILEK